MIDDLITVKLPDEFFKVVSGSFGLVTVQTQSNSPFSPNAVRYGGARFQQWTCDLEMARMNRETWQAYEAWAANIMDKAFAFELYDPTKQYPLGLNGGINSETLKTLTNQPFTSGSGDSYISGGIYDGSTFCRVLNDYARYSNSIVVEGLPVDSVVLKRGDNFSLGGNLYMVRGECKSNSEGQARIDFLWKLHKPQIEGDIVDFYKPKGRFIMPDGIAAVSKSPPLLGNFNISAAEYPLAR